MSVIQQGVPAASSPAAPSAAAPAARFVLRLPAETTGLAPLLAVGLVVATGLSALGAVDATERHQLWSNSSLLVAGLTAAVAIWIGIRRSSGRDRNVRIGIGLAAGFWVALQADHLFESATGLSVSIGAQGLLLAGMLAAVAFCWHLALDGRMSRTDGIAVYLDSAIVFAVGAAAVLLLFGRRVGADPHEGLLLGSAIVFVGTLSATLVLYLAITPVRRPAGWIMIVVGLATLGTAFLWRVGAGAGWSLHEPLAVLGSVITGYGAATWTGEIDRSALFLEVARRIRGVLSLAAVAVTPLLLVENAMLLPGNGAGVGLAVDVSLAIVLIFSVVRQTIMFNDRDRIIGEARRAAARERALRTDLGLSEQRFRTLVHNSSDVFLIISSDGTVAYQSPAVERVLGYGADERRGRQIFELTHPDDTGFVQSTIRELMALPGAERTIELRTRHADGSWRTVEATGKNMLSDPVIRGIVVNYRDITERKELERQLIHEAFHDPLTALANRALFTDRVQHALERRGAGPALTVLFMDLDDFKTINDSLGHGAGDQLLIAVGERIRACVRPEDTVARLGGDEFGILIENAEAGVPEQIAERILASFRVPFEIGAKQVHTGTSIGLAVAGAEMQTADEILRNADVAMYTAKNRGKQRVEPFEASMHVAVLTRMELKADLERALEQGELRLRYQPVFELAGGRLAGFEALLRWEHPERGEVMPGDFIALAEETGQIVPIGNWVLDQACRQARQWADAGNPWLRISVNLSARQLREAAIVEWVQVALTSSGLDPNRLILELTESGIMQDDEGRLRQLRALGLHLALDDFGTGYSSLSYLSRFPIDILKIDRSFIAQLGNDAQEAPLVRSVMQLGTALDLLTVAEGIETLQQLARVRALGVTYGQGFLLARPMAADAATRLVAANATLDQTLAKAS